jgi:hypothetical protein
MLGADDVIQHFTSANAMLHVRIEFQTFETMHPTIYLAS